MYRKVLSALTKRNSSIKSTIICCWKNLHLYCDQATIELINNFIKEKYVDIYNVVDQSNYESIKHNMLRMGT